MSFSSTFEKTREAVSTCPGTLQDPEKAFCHKTEEKTWSGCAHRKSEIAPESLEALTEVISLPKADSKTWGGDSYFKWKE